MSQSEQKLRQPVVVVLGHTDAGKCVSAETLIQLADGRIARADALFDEFKSGPPIDRPDGVAYEADRLELLSTSPEGKVAPRRASHVWKLHADRLIEVQTKAGYSVRCTPEHKFLAMSVKGELSYVEAQKLTLGDHLVIPTKVDVASRGLGAVKSGILTRVSDDFLIKVSEALRLKMAAFADGRRQELGREFGDDQFIVHLERGYFRASVFRNAASAMGIPLQTAYDEIDGIKFASPKRLASHRSPWISVPKDEKGFEALAYIVGLLLGDGVAESGHLANTSSYLMDLFLINLELAFGVGASRAWRRTSFIVSHKGGKSLYRFLVEAFEYPVSNKSRSIRVPALVTIMPGSAVARFLRGFFDAEGFVQEGKNIGVGCESQSMMRELPLLLARFGCLAYFGKKGHGNQIFISGKDNVRAFVEQIGFGEKEKMLAARIKMQNCESNRIFDMTPISGEFLRRIRENHEAIWDRGYQISSFDARARVSGDVIRHLSSVIPTYDSKALLETINNYASVEVSGLAVIEGECDVYDFTVEDYHNFLGNGLIIHNTSLLDRIRGTGVQAREAGGITQEIGASFFPMETLESICGPLLTKTGGQLKIPGLLVIDTPGHEIFSNLRMRGGSAADIAILLVDVLKGLENQTMESIGILKERRVPFLVALNKVDMIRGWRKDTVSGKASIPLATALKQQPPEWNDELEERLYNVVGGLSRAGYQAEAFYRIQDFRKQVAIIPVSARNGVGIPELLAVLIGLAQQFLTTKLSQGAGVVSGRSKGIVLELQEEVGMGQTANIILTDGTLHVGDKIVIVKREGAMQSKVKALFMPKPLDEMRDPRDKFTAVDEVYAAAGVKLVSPDLQGVIPGTTIMTFEDDSEFERLKVELEKDLSTLRRKSDNVGVVVKAGSIGGLEALIKMLEERSIPVRLADIGDISKAEIVEAESVAERDPYLGVILGFDVKVVPEAKESASRVQIITSEVIYDTVEGYVQWVAKKKEEAERTALQNVTMPAKVKALKGNFFRRNDPAVFGVEILSGKLRPKVRLMNQRGEEIGIVEQIQENGKNIPEAGKGMQVAISVKGPTLGRTIKEDEDLFTFPTSHDAKILKGKYAAALGPDDQQALEEIVAIRSAKDVLYGF
ncbi:MAG TPA: translation initiation factor IF-2 [Nitrososphaerales archaeon]|nr:translation initiation factor IF-2 [Nitrososphaerales archaeon]